jgi:hypothetical protein
VGSTSKKDNAALQSVLSDHESLRVGLHSACEELGTQISVIEASGTSKGPAPKLLKEVCKVARLGLTEILAPRVWGALEKICKVEVAPIVAALTALNGDKALPVAEVEACKLVGYELDTVKTLADWSKFRRMQEDMRSLMRGTTALTSSLKTVWTAVPDMDKPAFLKAVDEEGTLHAGMLVVGMCTTTQAFGKTGEEARTSKLRALKWWSDNEMYLTKLPPSIAKARSPPQAPEKHPSAGASAGV